MDSCLADQKEFTEPVALSSTCHVDLPLARSACVTGFDLVALRARCTANLRPRQGEVKRPWREKPANCTVSFSVLSPLVNRLGTAGPRLRCRGARRTDVRTRRRAPGRGDRAHGGRSGGHGGRAPELAGARAGHRPGGHRAPSDLVLRPSRARPLARRLDVPRGERRLQPHLRRRAPPRHDARGGGLLPPRSHGDGAGLVPHPSHPPNRDARRASRVDRARRDDPCGDRRARVRGRDHRPPRRAVADRDPAGRVRGRALARRP